MSAATITPQRGIIMAMKDIKSVQVAPGDEDGTARLWMSFGWELKNKQRVKTQDVQKYTGQDSKGTKFYETTKGDDFFEMTFERDPERQNYAELVSLEKQYYGMKKPADYPPYQPDPVKRFGLLWGILAFVGILLYVLPGIAIIIWRCVSYSKRKRKYEEALKAYEEKAKTYETTCSDYKRKREEILKQAQSLV